MDRDEQIINALAELENLKYQLLESKEALIEAVNDENKKHVKDCVKISTRVGLIICKVTGLMLSTILCLAYINTLGIPTPYVHVVKGVPLGLQNYLLFFRSRKNTINLEYSKSDKLHYELEILKIDTTLAFIDKAYNSLFKELSLDSMNNIVKGFEVDPNKDYLEVNCNNAKTKSKASRF